MQVAIIVFQDLTLLDLVGFYDPLARLNTEGFIPDLGWCFCSYSPSPSDSNGFSLAVDLFKPELAGYDILCIRGGRGTRGIMNDQPFLTWLQTARSVPLKVSACMESPFLVAAGFPKDKKATIHFDEYELLASFGADVIKKQVAEDRGCITGKAVASSIDVGLYLCEKLAGKKACRL